MNNPLNHIRIVLVNTTHPGNIGATARAMKTMGLSRLYLVAPKSFPDNKAKELASGADDVLEQATVVPELADALQDCHLIVGSSARSRYLQLPVITPRQAGNTVAGVLPKGEVAIVFGREHAGLTNEELLNCHYQLIIPTAPDYSVLNVSASVQIICYEMRLALTDKEFESPQAHDEPASYQDVQGFYQHMESVLQTIHVLRPSNPRRLLPRLQRLFNRIQLEKAEVRLLRGILTAIQKHMVRKNEKQTNLL